MKEYGRWLRTAWCAGLILAPAMATSGSEAPDLIDVFEAGCLGTGPDFTDASAVFKSLGLEANPPGPHHASQDFLLHAGTGSGPDGDPYCVVLSPSYDRGDVEGRLREVLRIHAGEANAKASSDDPELGLLWSWPGPEGRYELTLTPNEVFGVILTVVHIDD